MVAYTWIIIMTVACVVVPSITILSSVSTMTGPPTLIRRPAGAKSLFAKLPADIARFVAKHALQLVDVLQYGNIPFAAYRMPAEAGVERYLVVMQAGGRMVCDIVTDFSAEQSLTTARHTSAFVHPRPPGGHIQGFPGLTLDKLLERHLEGELWLLQQGKVTPGPLEPDLAKRIEQGLRRQGACIKAYPLFWLKAPWWFWVTRHRMSGKSVAQQAAISAA